MSIERTRKKHLLEKHFDDTLSSQEQKELLQIINANPNNEDWAEILLPKFYENKTTLSYDKDEWNIVIQWILKGTSTAIPISRHRFMKAVIIKYAAAFLIMAVGAGLAFWISKQKSDTNPISKTKQAQSKNAQLILNNGSVILLDTTNNGNFAYQGATQIIKLKDGVLSYKESTHNDDGSFNPSGTKSSTPVDYNILSTPKGCQYQVELPDGSKVWLNAASSLKFPTSFKGEERIVEINGEAYFEIIPNTKQIFIVKANGVEIQVLGTSFNVHAYEDEPLVTTSLLDGSVKVINGSNHSLLKPGQQSQFHLNSSTLNIIHKVNMNGIIAWKNGKFNLENRNIEDVMKEISRWYDIKVIYQGKVPAISFWGEMHQDASLATILDFFKKSGLNFKMDHNKKILTIFDLP